MLTTKEKENENMNLENYITELRDLATNLEDDVAIVTEMADGLEELKDTIEGATDFYAIKEALEEFDCFTSSPYDLIQADYEDVLQNFKLEEWKEAYADRITLGEVPPIAPTSTTEAEAKKKGKKTKK